ncbi:MAG: hypothetical protein NDI61_12320, partial [Bdellovibrionaceae bacterium]|nr:hypothetical protein [Pseudobdellovibrionaceae bacterium]
PVNKAGDTMTGLLVLSADPAANLGAATKQYVDSAVSTAGGAYIKKDGTVVYTADQSMGGFKITNVADPALAQDAATKNYVDTGLAGKQASLGFTPVNKAGDTMTGTLSLPSNGLAVGTNQLVVSAGKVGVGTASPAASLNVVSPNGTVGLKVTTDISTAAVPMVQLTDPTRSVAAVINSVNHDQSYNGMYLATTSAHPLILGANNAERVRITTTGFVGIGTMTPQAQLDIAGTDSLLIPRGTTAQQPGTPVNGMMRYNSTTNKFEARENGVWVNMIGGGAGGITSFNGLSDATQTFAVPGTSGTAPAWTSATGVHTLNIPLASAAGVTAGLLSKADYDAFNGKQAALGFTPVNIAGDTMTGLLVLSADPAAALGAATKQYVDSAASTAASSKVSKAGDTMTGTLNLPANGLVVGTDQLIVSGGNVGVGTTTPGAKLDVKGALRLSGATSGFTGFQPAANAGSTVWTLPAADGSTGQILSTNGTGILSWSNAGTGDFRANGTVTMTGSLKMGGNTIFGDSVGSGNLTLDSTSNATKGFVNINPSGGSVGIGTASPASLVHITSNRTNGSTLRLENTDNNGRAFILYSTGSSNTTGAGYFRIYDATDSLDRMIITPTGTIGMGTSSPQADLDVAGTGSLLVPRGTTAQRPGTPINGMLRYNASTNKFEAYENGAWVNMIGGGGGGITSLNGLTDATQTFAVPGTSGTAPAWTSATGVHTLNIPMASAAGVTAGLLSKADYDTFNGKQAALGFTPVNKAGDTMTGLLVLSADPSANLGAATKQYVDSVTATAVAAKVSKAGDTMTGTLNLPANGLVVGTSQLVVSGGNVGVGMTGPVEKLDVTGNIKATSGQVYSAQNVVATGATVDFNAGNVQILEAPGAAALTLNNMKDGASYTLIVTDTTSRTYTFGNCTNPHFVPDNGPTTVGSQTIYTVVKVSIASATHCYISWITGF